MSKNSHPQTAQARRSRVAELIESGVIKSQADLVTALKKSGFIVTQGTASRDIEELGAHRGRNSRGEMAYQLSSLPVVRVSSLPADLILSVSSSANLAVVRTPPGGAQLLASALDHSLVEGVIGTIAGDDTVLVVSSKASGGAQLAKELLALASNTEVKSKK